MAYKEPSRNASRRSIGNLDGSSFGTGGTDTVRIQPGTGDFLSGSSTVVDNSYVSNVPVNLDIKIQNIGAGAGSFARKERDGLTYSFRRILGGDGVAVLEQNDSILITGTGGVNRFVNLLDAPSTYVGQNGKVPVVDEANSRLVFQDISETDYSFLELTDTPDSYFGHDGKFLRVNAISGRVEFANVPVSVQDFLSLTDTPDTYVGSNGKFLTVNATTGKIEFSNVVIPESGNKITFAETPPTSPAPQEGDGWWNTTDGSFYLFYEDADGGQWVESGASEPASTVQDQFAYDYGAYFDGQPLDGETIYRWRAPRAHKLSADFDGCLFTCGVNPTEDFACTVWINGQQVGIWTINTVGAATMVSSVIGEIDVPANQEIKIVGPAQADGTIADLVISFKGDRY